MEGCDLDYGLEFLLAFDGRIHHLEEGYRIKFEIKRIKVTKGRPHGLSYSFTLHAPDGTRLVGFDNGHGVPAKGSRFKRRAETSDHWHPDRERSRQALRIQGRRHFASGFLSGGPQDSDRSRHSRNRCQRPGREEVTK